MPAGLAVQSLSSGYNPAASATDGALHQKLTTGVNTAQRLGALCTGGAIPLVFPPTGPAGGRPPRHLLMQVPVAAANPIYVSWDNNTAPVVGGPGAEIVPGGYLKFELGGDALLTAKAGPYPVTAGGAIQVIATAATVILANFSE